MESQTTRKRYFRRPTLELHAFCTSGVVPLYARVAEFAIYGSKFDVGIYLRPTIETLWKKHQDELNQLQADEMLYCTATTKIAHQRQLKVDI